MTIFDEETERAIDEYIEEMSEAQREHDLLFWEGCTIVTAPTGAPPEYITVEVDGVNDPNVDWRGVPPTPAVGDEVLVWENPTTHRREIVGASGASGVTGGGSWCQKVVVAECGGDFTSLSAAITWINALPAGQVPAATRLYAINILGGNFAEAADVTVPQYVHVSGEGEGTEIEMGAFSLIMSSDTSLQDVVVESSDPVDAIRINGEDNVVLRDVRCIQGAAADCYHVYGASTNIELYHCIANATTINAVGFHVGDTADVLMDYCKAEDATNFADALLLDATLCAAITRWCTFIGDGDDVQTGANSVWYHLNCHFDPNNSTLAAGTHFALPTKRFNQTVIVAEYGGDFQTVSEAVAWINAQGDAASGKRYGIFVLVGNFAEAAGFTIPQYVDLAGLGEGSRIEMGANILDFDDYSAALDVVVTSSHATSCLSIGGETDVELRNVKVISTGGGWCFNIGTSTVIALYDCIAECPAPGGSHGFHISGTASDIVLEGCTADTTNLTHALYVTNTAEVTTKFCSFRGATDVEVMASAVWTYHEDNFDYRNCTITGTATPSDSQSVIWFDHTVAAANAAAITAAINWVMGRTRVGDYIIDVAAGSHDVGLTFIDIPDEGMGNIYLQGDVRNLAGLSYVSGPQTAAAWAAITVYAAGNIVQPTAPNDFYYKCQTGGTSAAGEPVWPTALNGTVVDGTVTWICCGIPNNRAGLANGGGTGAVCMIASAANTLTVTMTTTPGGVGSDPNFAADGWVNGDTLIAMDNAGAVAVHTITGVAANVITIGAGAPVLGNLGTAFTLLPNRAIARTAAGPCITNHVSGLTVIGIYLDTATGADCHGVDAQNGYMELENVAIRAEDTGIELHNDASVRADTGALSLIECYEGVDTLYGGVGAWVPYTIAYDIGHYAFRAQRGYIHANYAIVSTAASIGYGGSGSEGIDADYAYALDCAYGFFAQFFGSAFADYAVAEGCTTAGFATLYLGGMRCDWSAARNCLRGYWGYYNSYMYAANTVNNCAGNTTNHSPAVTDTEGNVYAIITFT